MGRGNSSAAVVGVDRDVVVGQVAGPHGGLAGAEPRRRRGCGSRGPSCSGRPSARRSCRRARRPWRRRCRRTRSRAGRGRRPRRTCRPPSRRGPSWGRSPAIAVLTSGELAMAKPMRRAAASLSAPATSMVTNLVSALAVLDDLDARARASGRAARRRRPRACGARGARRSAARRARRPRRWRTAARCRWSRCRRRR